MRIFAEVPRARGVKRQWGFRERQFLAFLLAIFRILYLETRPGLLYGDTQSVVGYSMIPKCMTLSDLELVYRVKFCRRARLAGPDRATFEK